VGTFLSPSWTWPAMPCVNWQGGQWPTSPSTSVDEICRDNLEDFGLWLSAKPVNFSLSGTIGGPEHDYLYGCGAVSLTGRRTRKPAPWPLDLGFERLRVTSPKEQADLLSRMSRRCRSRSGAAKGRECAPAQEESLHAGSRPPVQILSGIHTRMVWPGRRFPQAK
jgi:hypothetical protein